MYQSPLDPLGKLEFPFDPLRALHAREDAELRWTEFPYKQVLIDRVCSKAGATLQRQKKVSVEATAGALLMAMEQETGALVEIEQHRPREDGEETDADGKDQTGSDHELVRGCRLMLFESRHYGHPLASVIKRSDVDLEEETEFVVVSYDLASDTHLVRKGESEDTKWLSLHNTLFRVLPGKPVARLEND